MKTISTVSLALSLASVSFFAAAQSSQSDFNFPPPSKTDSSGKMTLWATQYKVHEMKSGGSIPFVDVNGNNLGVFADTCNFCDAALEGTAFIKDASGKVTVLNYAKSGDKLFVDCRKCKKFSKSKDESKVDKWGRSLWVVSSGYGDGVLNYRLVPFRTIAVDNKVIPYGSVIYLPAVKGKLIELPNGEKVTHDGYFFAGDKGGAIKNNHIDVFTGVYDKNPFADVIKSNASKTFEAYKVTDATIINALKAVQTKSGSPKKVKPKTK